MARRLSRTDPSEPETPLTKPDQGCTTLILDLHMDAGEGVRMSAAVRSTSPLHRGLLSGWTWEKSCISTMLLCVCQTTPLCIPSPLRPQRTSGP